MTVHVERLTAFAFLSLFSIVLLAPEKSPPEPVAAAVQRSDDRGTPEGDYRDAIIDAPHARILELEREVADGEGHHEAVHRGECVPRPGW